MLVSFAPAQFAQVANAQAAEGETPQSTDVVAIPCSTNALITFGQVANGALATGDCVNNGRLTDEYRFQGTAGQQIVITLNANNIGAPNELDPAVALFNSSGTQIAFNDDGNTSGSSTVVRNSRIPAFTNFFTLPATGTYFIQATSSVNSSTQFGNYSLTLIDGGVPPCAATFLDNAPAPNNVVSGSLATDDCLRRGQFYTDIFAITGRGSGATGTGAGQSVTFDLASTQFDAYLILHSGSVDGPVVVEDNDGGGGTNSRVTFTLQTGVTYFLEVSSALSNQRGNYTLTTTTNLAGGTIPVSIGNTSQTRGTTIQIPITVGALPANTIRSFEFTVAFDPTVLRLGGTAGSPVGSSPISTTGTLTPNSFDCSSQNLTVAGQARIACFSTSDTFLPAAAGTLINLNFEVIGNNGTTSPVSLPFFRFNEDNPLSFIFSGGVTVNQFRITGNVLYGLFPNGSSGANTNKPVANAIITASGNPLVITASNLRGAYALEGLSSNGYQILIRKAGDVLPGGGTISPQTSSPISAFDASIAARIAVGNAVNPVNGTPTSTVPALLGATPTNQQRAADASGNGEITAFDAALISVYAVGGTVTANNLSGQWTFAPTNIFLPLINASLTNQNFQAILIGDPSGNWVQPCIPNGTVICGDGGTTALPKTGKNTKRNSTQAINVSLPTLKADQAQTLTVPVAVSDLSDKNAFSYDFDLRYDPTVLRLAANPLTKDGTVSSNFAVVSNTATAGRVRVAAYGTQPLTGSGTLLNVNFEVIGNPGASSDLKWNFFTFNEGDPQSTSANGKMSINGSATPTNYDFDGDGLADISVYRDGTWFVNRSKDGFVGLNFGLKTDSIAAADFDGDEKTDYAVFRGKNNADPNKAYFYVVNSFDNSVKISQFGREGDVPVVGDYDGDRRADLAVYRAGATTSDQSYFYYRSSADTKSDFKAIPFGLGGDIPVVGDYDGDKIMDIAVFRPSDKTWYIRQSSDGAVRAFQWGLADDKLVPADYDGDGKTDVAVYRKGNWYILGSKDGFKAYNFGLDGDIPVVADYDGDHKADISVYRKGIWYSLNSASNYGFTATSFGLEADKPVPNSLNQ